MNPPKAWNSSRSKLGYENKSYFTKLFKIHTGTTPGEFRGEGTGAPQL
jgi:two-component system response regulator YesN